MHYALHLVFENNLFKLGDTFWQQTSGTAMGTPPAPQSATLFFAEHEDEVCRKWSVCIWFYKRYIDDVFGIWLVDECPATNHANWTGFCKDMNAWHGLEWKCTTPALSCNFMDLTISIVNGRIHNTVYEKEMNFYLYIPPHSSHPSRGVFTGLIFGQILQIRRLCTSPDDATAKIQQFFDQLIARGHTNDSLLPIFDRAYKNATAYLLGTPEDRELKRKRKLVNSKNKYTSTFNTIPIIHPHEKSRKYGTNTSRIHLGNPLSRR